MSHTEAVFETVLPLPLVGRGKVRDVYEFGDDLLIVATDRLSAFDVVFPDAIPSKGRVLTALSHHWFRATSGLVANHIVEDTDGRLAAFAEDHPVVRGRTMLCRRARVVPVECVVRGYIDGSAWKSYEETGSVCGIPLPPGLRRRQRLASPIFTPTTKATHGHDEPITFEQVVETIGAETAEQVRIMSLRLYKFAHDLLLPKGIVISDTKFEFGITADGRLIVVDEMLTPDSSRYWEAGGYTPEGNAVSMDKQFVRDYVEGIGWNKRPPAPSLPPDVVRGMRERYFRIFEIITGRAPGEEEGWTK